MKRTIHALLTLAFCALPSLAVDGTVLINQATVNAAGGFPYLITQPGSYKLSGNLTVLDAAVTAIKINADYVTLDLNGFSILGPVVCTGTPVTSCTPVVAGGPSGIDGSSRKGITIMNGTVKGMGLFGINLDGGQGSLVEKVHADSNGSIGILTGQATLLNNSANGNGLRGIQNSGGPMIGNYAFGNKQYGIIANCPGSVFGNTAHQNGTNLLVNGGTCVASTNAAP